MTESDKLVGGVMTASMGLILAGVIIRGIFAPATYTFEVTLPGIPFVIYKVDFFVTVVARGFLVMVPYLLMAGWYHWKDNRYYY